MGDFEDSFSRIIKNGVQQKHLPKKVNQKVIDGVLSLILQSPADQDITIIDGFFDSYLWPFFSTDATDSHVLLVAIAFQVKRYGVLNISDAEKLHHFIIRSIELFKKRDTSSRMKTYIVRMLNLLFLRLSNPVIRRQTSSFVSILTWSKLPNLEMLLQKNDLKNFYESQLQKREKLSSKSKVEQVIINNFFYELLVDAGTRKFESQDDIEYFSAVFELLISLIVQLPTRRFMKTLLVELQVIPTSKANATEETQLNGALHLLEFYMKFPIDEFTGEIKDSQAIMQENSAAVSKLQALVYHLFKDKLGDIAFASHNTFENQENLAEALRSLSEEELEKLVDKLDIKPPFPLSDNSKIHAIIFQLKLYKNVTSVLSALNSLPSDSSLKQNLNSTQLLLPILEGQYLSMSDFIYRFYLFLRADSFEAISQHLQRTITRFEFKPDKGKSKVVGSSKHATKITSATFQEESSSSLESDFSLAIKGSVQVDLHNALHSVVEEWNSLKNGDTVLLVKIEPKRKRSTDKFEQLGISLVRSAIVRGKANSNNKATRNFSLELTMDGQTFKTENDKIDDYKDFNLLVKLPVKLSKFNINLQQILKIVESSDSQLPEWLYESFLGYGDANSGNFKNLEQISGSLKLLSQRNSIKDVQNVISDIHLATDEQEQKRRKTDTEITSSNDQIGPFMLNISGKELSLLGNTEDVSSLSRLNPAQLEALIGSLYKGLVLVDGAAGTGKRTLVAHMCNNYLKNNLGEKTLIVAKNFVHLKSLLKTMTEIGIEDQLLFNISDQEGQISRVDTAANKLQKLLSQVDELAFGLGVEGAYGDSTETAQYFFKYYVHQRWLNYLTQLKSNKTSENIFKAYPFSKYGKLNIPESESINVSLEKVTSHYTSIVKLFDDISKLAPLEFLKSTEDKINHLFSTQSKIVAVTIDDFIESAEKLQKMEFSFENLILSEASQLTQLEALLPIILQTSYNPEKIVLLGDQGSYAPATFTPDLKQASDITTSLVKRLGGLGSNIIHLSTQYNRKPSITHLLEFSYPGLTQDEGFKPQYIANAGLLNDIQYITIQGKTIEPIPNIFQNVEEAEFAIHLYQYLRLLGYPSETVSILTVNDAQAALLKEISAAKCGESLSSDDISHFAFGMPNISTIQENRGKESEIVILSTVKESESDNRLITAAISSAKLGFYALGSPDLLELVQSSETDSPLKRLIDATEDHKLRIVTGEMYSGVTRISGKKSDSYVMENLEHFSQFVYEMTQKRTSLSNAQQ